jgi:hypothetical protein
VKIFIKKRKKKLITIDLKKFKLNTFLKQLIQNKILYIKLNLNNKKKLKPLIRIITKKKKNFLKSN